MARLSGEYLSCVRADGTAENVEGCTYGQSAVVLDLGGNSCVWHLDRRRHHGIGIALGLDAARNAAGYRGLDQSLSGDPLSSACVECFTRKCQTLMRAVPNSP